jgi:hypothetical protein
MAQDTYTEVSSRGWFGRLGGAFKGIIFGLVLMGLATWLLFSNEGRAVRTAKTLKEGGGAVVAVSADRIDPSFEGRLVHISGQALTGEILTDPEFLVTADAIHLERRVEMYQWQQSQSSETKKKVGGGTETETTYSYSKGWSDRLIDSQSFKVPEGHENPGEMPYSSKRFSAETVEVGAFRLSSGLIAKMSRFEPLSVTSRDLLPPDLRYRVELQENGFYLGFDPSSPRVGDVRVSFYQVPPAEVSVVGQQSGSTIGPYAAQAGGTIELLSYGTVPPEQMFEAAERSNTLMTWLIRLGGLFLMFLGLRMIFRPLSVMADVVPALGNLVEAGTGFVSFLIAAFLSAAIIAVAWIFYRPLIGITLVAFAVALVVAVVVVLRKAGRRRAATPAA